MKKLIVLSCVVVATPSAAEVRVPYFSPLSDQAVCGGVPRHCRPTSSEKFTRFGNDPVPYNGRPSQFLGRKFGRIREAEPCVTAPISEADVNRSGRTTVSARARSNSVSRLQGKVAADLRTLVERVVATLPEGARAAAKAEVDRNVTTESVRNLVLEYERIDLNQVYIDNHIAACIASLGRNERMITGIAVMTVSGDWTRSRLRDVLAAFEASAAFREDISVDARARYEAEKNSVLNSALQPTSFLISAAWRKRRR